jgi:hypothetical protein
MSDNQQEQNTPQEQDAQPVTTETQPAQQGTDKSYTQADIDRMISERLKRDRNAQESKLLEALGVDSIDSLKSALDAKREQDQAQMTEAEKAKAEAEQARAEASRLKQELEAMQTQRINDGRQSAFNQALRKHGAGNEDQLYILVNAQMNDKFTGVFDEGSATADDSKMTAFIKEVQAKFPMYFGNAGAGSPSNAGGINPTSKEQALKEADDSIKNIF